MNDSEKLDLVLAKLDALAQRPAGNTDLPVPVAYWPNEADISALKTGLNQLGYRSIDLSDQNIYIMLQVTNGNVEKSIKFFTDDVQAQTRGKAIEQLQAQGNDNPTEPQIADRASYLWWADGHDQGTRAVSIAQGFIGPGKGQ